MLISDWGSDVCSSDLKPKNENGDGTKMAIKWDEDFDVICVGSGLGGLSAALTAAQRGARDIVLEKFELLGGVSALSSGQLWLGPPHLARKSVVSGKSVSVGVNLGGGRHIHKKTLIK